MHPYRLRVGIDYVPGCEAAATTELFANISAAT
jgi:hypothetical protein